MKIAVLGVVSRVDVSVKKILVGRSPNIRVGGQLPEEVRVTSWVPQRKLLGPLLFLEYVNNIWRSLESNIKLLADDCIIYRKIMNDSDRGTLQIDLDRMGQ
jgi:hypothetical protein